MTPAAHAAGTSICHQRAADPVDLAAIEMPERHCRSGSLMKGPRPAASAYAGAHDVGYLSLNLEVIDNADLPCLLTGGADTPCRCRRRPPLVGRSG
jgi:hypothetical protein